ncbi:MAG: oxaloacetate decarboxylase [Alphaproteobacteria bacterium]
MASPGAKLRALLKDDGFVYMPAVYYPLGGKMAQSVGFPAAYVGGYVTGGSLALSEPLVNLTEQAGLAGQIASVTDIPIVADAGAGFGEPLHCMRTVREFIRQGVAGIHIEDQLYPKRAHYHKYVAHAIPADELVDKIRWSCKQRDESDPDFVVIARTDVCRFEGLDAAAARINQCAEVGADMGLLFPRSVEEAERAPKVCNLPLIYVLSRGNRDGRPLFTPQQLKDMGYKACIDAQLFLLVSFHYAKQALEAVRDQGDYTGLSQEDYRNARQSIEDMIGLDRYYEIEEATVEDTKWGKR